MPDELELRAAARIGRILNDKWRLDRLLGVGGMAAVYAARHRNGAKAALKLLHPELAADATVRERFLHEGKAANLVDHPNAVQVMDDDIVREGSAGDEGAAYLVMELLNGESLLQYAQRLGRTLSEEEVLEISDGVLEVLEAAHAHAIVHRDLKPENLFLVKPASPQSGVGLAAMLKEWTNVKVLDFGIARIADGGGKTRVGTTLGTPTYMAPEQAQGRRDAIDGRTDLFALGATMWRLLTGARVHEGPSSAEILAKMATVPAAPVRSIAPQLSESIARIVDRAVKFQREERYPDARTMREDVRAAREGRPLPYVAAAIVEERTAAEGPRGKQPAASFVAAAAEPTPGAPGIVPLAPIAPLPTVANAPALGASPAAATEIPRTDQAIAPPIAPRRRTSPAWLALLAIIPLAAVGLYFALRSSPAPTTSGDLEGKPASSSDDESSKGDDDDDKPATKPKSVDDDPTTASTAATADDDDQPSGGSGSSADPHGVTTATTSNKKPIGATATTAPKTATTKPTTSQTAPKPTNTAGAQPTTLTPQPTTNATTLTPPPPPPGQKDKDKGKQPPGQGKKPK